MAKATRLFRSLIRLDLPEQAQAIGKQGLVCMAAQEKFLRKEPPVHLVFELEEGNEEEGEDQANFEPAIEEPRWCMSFRHSRMQRQGHRDPHCRFKAVNLLLKLRRRLMQFVHLMHHPYQYRSPMAPHWVLCQTLPCSLKFGTSVTPSHGPLIPFLPEVGCFLY